MGGKCGGESAGPEERGAPEPGSRATMVATNKPAAAPGPRSAKDRATPHEFIWKYGGQKVFLTGSFDQWRSSVAMVHDQADDVFRATVNLDPASTWYYKFVVDGVWRCSLDFATETDVHGNVNNVLYPEAPRPDRSQ